MGNNVWHNLQVSQFQSAEVGADLVRHFNDVTDNPLRFWNIGNEPWLERDRPPLNTMAGIIAPYVKSHASAMRDVDPTIRIYAPDMCDFFGQVYEFNRPFDDQTKRRVRIETEAKLYVQETIRIHLNRCQGSSPLADMPEACRHSSYGGEDFLKRLLTIVSDEDVGVNRRRRRRMNPVKVDAILDATARQFGTSADEYGGFRSRTGGRDVAAMLCRRGTTATLPALSARFGLTPPDSTSDLIARRKRTAKSNRDVARQVISIEQALGLNPESRV